MEQHTYTGKYTETHKKNRLTLNTLKSILFVLYLAPQVQIFSVLRGTIIFCMEFLGVWSQPYQL